MLVYKFNGCITVPILFKYIMIALYQYKGKCLEIIPPFEKKIHLFILQAMEKIAHNHDFFWFEKTDLMKKSLEILLVN